MMLRWASSLENLWPLASGDAPDVLPGNASLQSNAVAHDALGIDGELVRWVHDVFQGPVSDTLLGVFSLRLGFAFPLLGLLLAYLAWRHGKHGVATFAATLVILGLGDLLGNGLKHLLAMPRPCFDLRGQLPWLSEHCPGAHRGMPSNHALNFFAVAAFVLAVLKEKWPGVLLMVIAALVGLSRVYLGRHYPSQVLVGTLLGIYWGAMGAWAWNALKKTALWQRFFSTEAQHSKKAQVPPSKESPLSS